MNDPEKAEIQVFWRSKVSEISEIVVILEMPALRDPWAAATFRSSL